MVRRCHALAKEAKLAIEDLWPDFIVVTLYLINSSCVIFWKIFLLDLGGLNASLEFGVW